MSVLQLLLLDTNLFDVIASLGTGLYVHHIEFTSFPLCGLNRNLPAVVPGREGGRSGVKCGVEGNKTKQKNQNDMERTEQKREQKNKANKKRQNRNMIK